MSLKTIKCLHDDSDTFKREVAKWNFLQPVDRIPSGEKYIKYDSLHNDWIVFYQYTIAAVPRYMSRHDSVLSAVYYARKR
jgi:hypothetical protein